MDNKERNEFYNAEQDIFEAHDVLYQPHEEIGLEEDIVTEESLQYSPEISEYTESDYMPVEAEYLDCGCHNETAESCEAEVHSEIEQYHVQPEEYPYEEADSSGQEFMVFAADGTLLSHNLENNISFDEDTTYTEEYVNEEEPQLIVSDETNLDIPMPVYSTDELGIVEIADDASNEIEVANPHMSLQRNVVLNVSAAGWNGIPGTGWTSGTINVTSNTTWTLSRSGTWLTPSLGLGNWSGNRSFTVNIARNTGTTTRSGMITLRAGNITRNISFQQLGVAPTANLTVSAGGWTGISAGGWTSGNINITSNIAWNINRNFTWLTPSIWNGSGSRSFTVHVAQNTTTTVRNGIISVVGGGITRNISFQQLAAVVVNPPTITSPAANATVPLQNLIVRWNNVASASFQIALRNLNTNVQSINTSLGAGSTQFTIPASSLTAGHRFRVAVATVAGGQVRWSERYFNVQVANLTVSAGGWTGISAGGWTSGNINITSNTAWNINRNFTWLTPSIWNGSGNRSFTVHVAQNTTTTVRNGIISVVGGGITRNITFQQLAAAATRTVTFNANGGSPNSTRTVQNGNSIGNLPNVTRTNHSFLGWFTAQNGGTQVNASTIINNNITFWARWQVTNATISNPTEGQMVPHQDLVVRWTARSGVTYNISMHDVTGDGLDPGGPVINRGMGSVVGTQGTFIIGRNTLSAGRRYQLTLFAQSANSQPNHSFRSFTVQRGGNFNHIASAPSSLTRTPITQNFNTRTQEVISFNDARARNNANYQHDLRQAGSSLTQLHQALFTGAYVLPFDSQAGQNYRPSNFSQGFWGSHSHAGVTRPNHNTWGAIDIGTLGYSRELYAMLDGTVRAIEERTNGGSIIDIESNINGVNYILRYLHVEHRNGFVTPQTLGIRVGHTVQRGARIGTVGGPPSWSIHLHLEVIRNGVRVDPLRFFDLEKQYRFGAY